MDIYTDRSHIYANELFKIISLMSSKGMLPNLSVLTLLLFLETYYFITELSQLAERKDDYTVRNLLGRKLASLSMIY